MSVRGLVAKPTTRQVMVHIRMFLYQGYDIRFYCEAHCRLVPVPTILYVIPIYIGVLRTIPIFYVGPCRPKPICRIGPKGDDH